MIEDDAVQFVPCSALCSSNVTKGYCLNAAFCHFLLANVLLNFG
jgi:hypothetical protein